MLIPLWLKISYTAFVAVLIPMYWRNYGPINFLWFSDIALLAMVPALWVESSLLVSTLSVSVLLPEIFWNIGYFIRLLSRRRIAGLTDYMWNREYSLFLRSLSLFHVFLPPVLLFSVWQLGYDSRALYAAVLLAWIVIPVTYALEPEENINWIHDFGDRRTRPPLVHLALLMFFFYPICIYLPTHFLLAHFFVER